MNLFCNIHEFVSSTLIWIFPPHHIEVAILKVMKIWCITISLGCLLKLQFVIFASRPCVCDFGLLHIHWTWGFCWLLKAFHLRLLFMIFKPSCFVLHELKTVVDRTVKRSSLTLATCLVYIANLANLDMTFTNMITFRRDSSVSWIQLMRLEVGFLLCKKSFVILEIVSCCAHCIPFQGLK